jgi:TRAP-type C4-dicarboxylate transport system permease small subunit
MATPQPQPTFTPGAPPASGDAASTSPSGPSGPLTRLAALAHRAAEGIGVGLFTALFLVFLVQVTARFGFDRPLPWTDEVAVSLYVVVILWAAATLVPEREHVVFDLVWNAAGRRTRQLMRVSSLLLLGGLAAWALPASWDYVSYMAIERTPVLEIPFMWIYAPFVLLLISLVARSLHGIWRALRGLDLEDAGVPTQ